MRAHEPDAAPRAPLAGASPAAVLALQRTAGNAALARLLAPPASRGSAIAAGARAPLERAFGQDFSGVRVHTDGEAARLARSFAARALSAGEDIYFGSGRYVPQTPEGQRLLAHELAHVA